MSVLNVSEETDPTFEWASKFGWTFNLGMADPSPKLPKLEYRIVESQISLLLRLRRVAANTSIITSALPR